MSNHRGFILSSVECLLEDAVNASRGIMDGITSFAISEYVFQSLFLRMTGFMEQKAKCICWELGSMDYDFRRRYFEQLTNLGEMSTYDSKKFVYINLLKIVSNKFRGFNIETQIDKADVLNHILDTIKHLFEISPLIRYNDRHFHEFVKDYNDVFNIDDFALTENNGSPILMRGKLINVYKGLYEFRNRCAHNVFSYQQNLPSLQTMSESSYCYENYYYRFAILFLIDTVYIDLFRLL